MGSYHLQRHLEDHRVIAELDRSIYICLSQCMSVHHGIKQSSASVRKGLVGVDIDSLVEVPQ